MSEIYFCDFKNVNEGIWQKIIETLSTVYPELKSDSSGIIHLDNMSGDENNRIHSIIDASLKRNIRFYDGCEKQHNTIRKELPMTKSGFITQWQNIAYTVAMVKGHNLTELYMNNFIDLRIHWKKERSRVDIYHNSTYIISCVGAYKVLGEYFDYYEHRMLGELYLDNPNNIIDLIIDNIDREVYTAVVLDNYYVKDSSSYSKHHSRLRKLFYGYDIERQELYCIGFNKNQIFATITMSFQECIDAYERNKLSFGEIDVYLQEFHLKEHAKLYKFDLSSFITKLEIYANSKKSETDEFFENWMCNRDNDTLLYCGYDHYASNLTYASGIEVYNVFISFLENEMENNIQPMYQNLHAVYEHKKLLLERIIYIDTIYSVISESCLHELNQVVKTLNISRILLLKYIYLNNDIDTKILRHIIDSLRYCMNTEKEILTQIILSLQKLV
ncbi:MAG: hypothetical protein GX625_02820 [Clostridiaceae bacterium]|nr:hypothetical protein [Clostridiaceae bacterium]